MSSVFLLSHERQLHVAERPRTSAPVAVIPRGEASTPGLLWFDFIALGFTSLSWFFIRVVSRGESGCCNIIRNISAGVCLTSCHLNTAELLKTFDSFAWL